MAKRISWIDILIIVLFVIAVYLVLTRIFGHSASELTISITLFTLIAAALYKLNREVGEFKIRAINSFDKLKEDLNLIKKKLKI